jgi:phosphoserine phosphatase RsbU/P
MSVPTGSNRPLSDGLAELLEVTRSLAAPFDLHTLLLRITQVAMRVVGVERVSVWLLDAGQQELFVEVAGDLPTVRVPVGRGLVGACAAQRTTIHVPDCYADARFNAEIDRRSGFHTHSMLSVPLVDHHADLVGVLQLLNKEGGAFAARDLELAEALAAQCAVALTRVRLTREALAGELLRQEVQIAAEVQRSILPAAMPQVPGYAMYGLFRPASATGGDTFDLALLDQGLLVVLADATGHGIGPALSVVQMHAMLRMAFSLGADLERAFRHVNDRLADTLPDGRFVTAIIGLLDPDRHCLRFLSGGQGPILHFRAAQMSCTAHRATSFPMGAMKIQALRPAVSIDLSPGDWIVLLSDGIYEHEDVDGQQFGRARVEQILHDHHQDTPPDLAARLLAAVQAHARGAVQDDDITMVLIRRMVSG